MLHRKIGLALSGGGARGFAHIGVLKVLKREGISIDCISGTSLGGVIAAAFAMGLPLDEIEQRALKLGHFRELVKLMDIAPARRGLLEGNRVRNYLQSLFPDEYLFETTCIPLALNAVDLVRGEEVTLKEGKIFPAVLATCAVPGIFPPVILNDRKLVDGGVLNNIPLKQIRELGADLVIAVNTQVDPRDEGEVSSIPVKINLPLPVPEYLMDLYWSGFVMVSRLVQHQIQEYPPDVYIYTHMPRDINMFSGFHRAEEIIQAGELAAQNALPQIKALMQ